MKNSRLQPEWHFCKLKLSVVLNPWLHGILHSLLPNSHWRGAIFFFRLLLQQNAPPGEYAIQLCCETLSWEQERAMPNPERASEREIDRAFLQCWTHGYFNAKQKLLDLLYAIYKERKYMKRVQIYISKL